MIKIEVHSTRAVIRSQEPLTVGLKGAKAHFSFGKPWETLIKTAVFRQGDKTVTVADIGTEVTIPWEVLTQPGLPVQIGVYGIDSEGTVAIPTVWTTTQPVRPGTDPEGDPSTEPTPGLWEQMQGKLSSLEESMNTADGITPHIGGNGNWFIGKTDTGMPSRGEDGHDGQDGEPGKDGEDGQPGKDGHTPVKGVDYWTEADKTEMVQQVIAAIGTPVIGKVDESNNILIAGVLDNGTYTVKYENADGTTTTIGEFTVTDSESGDDPGGDVVTITNQLPISTDYDGTVFNGTGYQVGKRINSGGTGLSDVASASSASNPVFVTGFIPCGIGSVVRFKNCYMATTANSTDTSVYGQTIDNFRLMLANSSKGMNQLITWNQLTTSDQITIEQDENGNVIGFTPKNYGVYIRMVLAGDPETAIITVNEEIPV